MVNSESLPHRLQAFWHPRTNLRVPNLKHYRASMLYMTNSFHSQTTKPGWNQFINREWFNTLKNTSVSVLWHMTHITQNSCWILTFPINTNCIWCFNTWICVSVYSSTNKTNSICLKINKNFITGNCRIWVF